MGKENSDIYLQNLGKHLKKLRLSKGFSLRGLATECSIDHSDIAKIERGEKNITFLTMVDIAAGLNIPVKKILDFDLED